MNISIRPASPNDLPEAALAVFAAWSRATEETIRKALEEEVGRGFVQPRGHYPKDHKCRDLTLLRSPLPRTLRVAGARSALSTRQLADIGMTTIQTESAPIEDPTSSVGSVTPGASTEERVDLLQSMLTQCLNTIVWKLKMIISVVIFVGVEIWSKKTIFQHRFE